MLRDVEKPVERLAQRREPQAVVNQFGVAIRKRLLEVRRLAVQREPFKFLMRFHQQRSAGSFVSAARFHAHEAVFDEVGSADAVRRRNLIQLVQKIDGAKLRAIDGNRGAGCKSDFHLLRLVRSFFRRNHPLPHGLARRIGGIFELSALVAEVPDVAVAAVDVFLDRKSTRLNSSHPSISYAVFCLKKKKKYNKSTCIITTESYLTCIP